MKLELRSKDMKGKERKRIKEKESKYVLHWGALIKSLEMLILRNEKKKFLEGKDGCIVP